MSSPPTNKNTSCSTTQSIWTAQLFSLYPLATLHEKQGQHRSVSNQKQPGWISNGGALHIIKLLTTTLLNWMFTDEPNGLRVPHGTTRFQTSHQEPCRWSKHSSPKCRYSTTIHVKWHHPVSQVCPLRVYHFSMTIFLADRASMSTSEFLNPSSITA